MVQSARLECDRELGDRSQKITDERESTDAHSREIKLSARARMEAGENVAAPAREFRGLR
jgi:hypothetical protein